MNTLNSTAAFALRLLAGLGVLLGLGGSSALAAKTVYLQAEAFRMTMPDGESVAMWGFAECDSSWTCSAPSAPGPQIDAASGDALTIHVKNTLDWPVSVIVPGQGGGGDPVFTTDGLGRSRVRSFTAETAAGSTGTYSFASVDSGTYLYQSGTHPSIQVPMGLYGALVVGPETGVTCVSGDAAYDSDDSCYDVESVLLFSEVDPWMNEAIDAATTVDDYPATVFYNPSYFLVNGEGTTALADGDKDEVALVRMLNAGLESHNPTFAEVMMGRIAEDGYLYPGLVRYQSSVHLAAGKTLDVIVNMPDDDITLSLFDRSARNNYSHMAGGGIGAELKVGTGTPADATPTVYAVDDTYVVTEDTTLSGSSVLANDVGLTGATVTTVHSTSNGVLTLATNGTFTYEPDADFSGWDSFTYRAESGGNTYPARVTLEVSFVNDDPVAADDGTYTNRVGADFDIAAPGVLANDSDPDGDDLIAVLDTAPTTGTLTLDADGSFAYTGGTAGTTVTFEYHAEDPDGATSDTVTVTLDVKAVSGIVLSVADPSGTSVTDFHWVVQEDATFKVDPANPPDYIDSQSSNFHKSYMPVIAAGEGATEFANVALDSDKQYYISVLPLDAGNGDGTGHTMGGAQILPGDSSVSVLVNEQPIPTARISVVVFEDNAPTNGAVDGGEAGLGGYQISLEDAGGRYGQNGGQMTQDAFGDPLTNALDCFGEDPPPRGVIVTCPDGTALIENLAPGKYGVTAAPPQGEEAKWMQTSTIEGSRVIDAWVKPGEAPFFVEFGGPGPHAFIGFLNPSETKVPADVPTSARTNDITGTVTLLHDPRPPALVGTVDSNSYVGLSHTRAWVGLNSIGGDGPSYATVEADEDGNFVIEDIPNGDYQLVVFDKFLDQIIAFQAVTLTGGGADVGNIAVNHWFTRLENNVFLDENEDGIRQAGELPLTEQAVNLRWRDGTVYQSFPTDLEGFVPFDVVFPFFNWLVAEVDYTRFKPTGLTVTVDAGGDVSGGDYPGLLAVQDGSPRTETGPVLTQAFQNFPGQTSILDWGKVQYKPGENGGISGIVFYSSTRGENDPRLTVGDTWEPGIPGVTVRLYREIATDHDGGTALTLVDEVTTDSWDDSLPTGCPGEDASSAYVINTLGASELTRCYDGWRNWNQMRPGVFDGGYAFLDIPAGDYVVEMEPPPGYEIVKEEDLNVGFGDVFDFAPVAIILPGGGAGAELPDMAMITDAEGFQVGIAQPPCVGATHTVADALSLFPDADAYTPYAGAERPLCNRKRVHLADQGQAAADFHLFTPAPVAAQYTGLVTDDLSWEYRTDSPSYGEKWSPANIPISLRDANGHEVYRTYTDSYGKYNGVAASTFNANLPVPSGYSPAMYEVCINDAGDGPSLDPHRNPNYGTLCYTMQFMPGATTYLDTPVLPSAGFATGYSPADCDLPDNTPALDRIDSALVAAGGTIELTSQGTQTVANPAYWGPGSTAPHDAQYIDRDYGFGASIGTVTLGGTALAVTSWDNDTIEATVPSGMAAGSYQLEIASGSGVKSINSLTLTVGTETPVTVAEGDSIQDAIDTAAAGSLILVEPGVYDEQVILWKPVRLQGAGSGATIINALKSPTQNLATWRAKVETLVDNGDVDLLPGQDATVGLFGAGGLQTESGAGVLVLAKDGDFDTTASRIDGFTILNADVGGGIVVNSYAHNLQVSNNLITRNSGGLHGGIRVGVPLLTTTGDGPFGFNTNVNIHHNAITRNGAVGEQGAGGGVSINVGSDDYSVTDNFICGNFTSGDGAGVGHLGLSDGGLIASNDILFNQSFNQQMTRSGGGVFVGGEAPEAPFVSLGAGDVVIDGNRIQGNQASAGHGGGIRTEYFNGRDVEIDTASMGTGPQQLGTASDYDWFVLGDLWSQGGGRTGRMAVGGDAYFNGGSLGHWSLAGTTALSVGGDFTVGPWGSGWSYAGDIEVGGSCSVPTWWSYVTHSSITCNTTPFDASAYADEMEALSDTLAALPSNGSCAGPLPGGTYSRTCDDGIITWNWGTVYLKGTDPDLNVFEFDLENDLRSTYGNINNLTVEAPAGSTVVVNVVGETSRLFKTGGVNLAGGIANKDIVWNFNGGGDLTVTNVALKGAVLAPTTDIVWNGGQMNGTVVARNLTLGSGGGAPGQNLVAFAGELPPTVGQYWYTLDITNNVIVNNVAGWSGAGMSLQDTAKAHITLNTVAHNDSTATAGALIGSSSTSSAQPAGISAGLHSAALVGAFSDSDQLFSNPRLDHNIIWENRAFSYDATGGSPELVPVLAPTTEGECASGADHWDLGVLGGTYDLDPRYNIMTAGTGSNDDSDPDFVDAYCNGSRQLGEVGPMTMQTVIEEGGNFVEVRYGPLAVRGSDYHIESTSPAIDLSPGAPYVHVDVDFDRDARSATYDAGADEYTP